MCEIAPSARNLSVPDLTRSAFREHWPFSREAHYRNRTAEFQEGTVSGNSRVQARSIGRHARVHEHEDAIHLQTALAESMYFYMLFALAAYQ